MKNWKSICRSLLFPPLWLIILLAVASTSALFTVFVKGLETSPIAYAVYTAAFYSLMVICLACWKTIPGYYKRIKRKMYDNKYTNRYLTDAAFKLQINLYSSLAINLLYAAINAGSAIIYHTHWFGIFAVYYAVMAVMRFLLVRYVGSSQIGKKRIDELKCSRLCACLLLIINLTLSGAVLMMIQFDRGFEYQGYLIYVMALYTFYITTTAIVDVVRYRKYHSPVMSAAKIIRLVTSLVSMLSLETAMFSQFGGDTSTETQKIMIIATSTGISIIVATTSITMIVCSTREIKKMKIHISEM